MSESKQEKIKVIVYHEFKQGLKETCFQTYKVDTQLNLCNS